MNETSFRFGFKIQIRIECVFSTRTLKHFIRFECETSEGKSLMRITISMILLRQSSLIASRAKRRTRLSAFRRGKPPSYPWPWKPGCLVDAEFTDPAHTLLRAMPIDETVCRGSHRRRRRYLLCLLLRTDRSPDATSVTTSPVGCIHVCVYVCMRLRSTHSCVANISLHVCVCQY